MRSEVRSRADAEKQTYGTNGCMAYKPERCVAHVYPADGGHWWAMQCHRKARYGPDNLFCKQHDPDEVARRDKERHAKWDAELAMKQRGWARQASRSQAADIAVEMAKWIAANRDLVNEDEWLNSIAIDVANSTFIQEKLDEN